MLTPPNTFVHLIQLFIDSHSAILTVEHCRCQPEFHHLSAIARFASDPSMKHFRALIRILDYLIATRDIGLCFQRQDTISPTIRLYCDSDFASDADDR